MAVSRAWCLYMVFRVPCNGILCNLTSGAAPHFGGGTLAESWRCSGAGEKGHSVPSDPGSPAAGAPLGREQLWTAQQMVRRSPSIMHARLAGARQTQGLCSLRGGRQSRGWRPEGVMPHRWTGCFLCHDLWLLRVPENAERQTCRQAGRQAPWAPVASQACPIPALGC